MYLEGEVLAQSSNKHFGAQPSVILEEYGLLPPDRDHSPAQVLVTLFGESSLEASYRLCSELRQAGIKTISYPTPDKLAKQFRHADRVGARLAIILGPDEIKKGEIAVKDLESGEQSTLPRSEVITAIRDMLD